MRVSATTRSPWRTTREPARMRTWSVPTADAASVAGRRRRRGGDGARRPDGGVGAAQPTLTGLGQLTEQLHQPGQPGAQRARRRGRG